MNSSGVGSSGVGSLLTGFDRTAVRRGRRAVAGLFQQRISSCAAVVYCLPLFLAATSPAGCSRLREARVAKSMPEPPQQSLVFRAGGVEQPDSVEPGTAQADYQAGEQLFRQEKYADAETVFRRVAREHKDTPIEEDALYMAGECQFLQRKYPKAQDTYDTLMKKFTNSRYVEKIAQREFQIAQFWLDGEDPASEGVRPAAAWLPDLKSKPLFDPKGRALQALSSVRLYDPTGPLADDALMKSASYHFSRGNYTDAEFYYDTLIHDYPKSEHLAQAYVLGAQAKLQAYSGARYNGKKLQEARQLIQTAVRRFPELEPDKPRLLRTLEVIRHQMAERDFEVAEFYRRTRKPASAELYYRMVVKNYPDTRWAEEAQTRLAQLEPASARSAVPVEPEAEPEAALGSLDTSEPES